MLLPLGMLREKRACCDTVLTITCQVAQNDIGLWAEVAKSSFRFTDFVHTHTQQLELKYQSGAVVVSC
jgi:hypothetical protein